MTTTIAAIVAVVWLALIVKAIIMLEIKSWECPYCGALSAGKKCPECEWEIEPDEHD